MSKIVINLDGTVESVRLWSRVMCLLLVAYAFFGGAVSLMGWIVDVPRLTDWGNHGISILPNTAIAVMAAGVALASLWRGFSLVGRIFAAIVLLVGLISVFQIVTAIHLPVNTWLMFDRQWGRAGSLAPGQIGTPGAVSWTLIGLSILLIWRGSRVNVEGRSDRLRIVGVCLSLLTLGISTLSITGYLFGAEALYAFPQVTVIAFQTATFVFALSLAIIISVSDVGPMRLFVGNSIAGSMVRRVVPAIIIIPILVGLLRLIGERSGLYDLAFGTAAQTLIEISFLLGLLWWVGRTVNQEEMRAELHQREARESERELRQLADAMPQVVWIAGSDGRVFYYNQRVENFGGIEHKSSERFDWRPGIHPDDLDATIEAWRDAETTNTTYSHEHRILMADGSYRWHLSRAVPVGVADGEPQKWYGTATDIHDIKVAEELEAAERKSDETRASLLARLGDLIATAADPATMMFAVSQAVCGNLGVRRCMFTEIDLDGGVETIHGEYSRRRSASPPERNIAESETTLAEMREGKTVVNNDSVNDERTSNSYADIYKTTGEQAYVAVPLLRGGKLIASFRVSSNCPRTWHEDEVRVIESIAERAWLAVGRLRSEDALRESEELLRRAKRGLEQRVSERTQELAATNDALRQEVEERKASEKHRVDLLQRLVSSQEFERRRIARDIHDQLGQRLTALRLKIASLREAATGNDLITTRIEKLQEIAEKLDSEVSFLAWELRPTALDDLGFVEAIGEYVREWSRHSEIDADFHAADLARVRLDKESETHLYRITQEALNNVAKHANASHVSVLLERGEDRVVLVVEDNGDGFDPLEPAHSSESSGGLGLVGMHERATLVRGEVEIESAVGNGTAIYVRVPYSE